MSMVAAGALAMSGCSGPEGIELIRKNQQDTAERRSDAYAKHSKKQKWFGKPEQHDGHTYARGVGYDTYDGTGACNDAKQNLVFEDLIPNSFPKFADFKSKRIGNKTLSSVSLEFDGYIPASNYGDSHEYEIKKGGWGCLVIQYYETDQFLTSEEYRQRVEFNNN